MGNAKRHVPRHQAEASEPWILVLGDTYHDWITFCLEGMSDTARVSFAHSAKDAIGKIRQEPVGPSVILIDADDLGGLEQAMQCQRRISSAAIYGKCFIKSRSVVLSQDSDAVPLMLASPNVTRIQ